MLEIDQGSPNASAAPPPSSPPACAPGALRPVIDRTFSPWPTSREPTSHLESNTQFGKIVVTVPR